MKFTDINFGQHADFHVAHYIFSILFNLFQIGNEPFNVHVSKYAINYGNIPLDLTLYTMYMHANT